MRALDLPKPDHTPIHLLSLCSTPRLQHTCTKIAANPHFLG